MLITHDDDNVDDDGRDLGPEGSLARTLADGQYDEVVVMRVAEAAVQALRSLGPTFQHFPDEHLLRLVRLGRLQARDSSHFSCA